MLDTLNYHHLFHFLAVARTGSISRAGRELHVAKSTLSAQIKALGVALGEPLFLREGRGLKLSEVGVVVQGYATEIFTLGRECLRVVQGLPGARASKLRVGVADTMPKTVVRRVLAPCLDLHPPITLVCHEGPVHQLADLLGNHDLDVVLADTPVTGGRRGKAFSHLLGECGVSVLGARGLANRHRRGFPRSLHGAPALVPTEGASVRSALDAWLQLAGVTLRVVGEFQDTALLMAFGQEGSGLVFVPSAVERDVCRQYALRLVGRLDAVRESFYAVSMERRVRHPGVTTILHAARNRVF